MKANEFVKRFGINIAERDVAAWESGFIGRQDFIDHFGFDLLPELKRLVESHETIELFGGLEKAMDIVINQEANGLKFDSLARAIADVESCQ